MAKLQVNVDVTSDIVCPWCWIGKKYLDTAIHHLKDDFEFTVHWKPFLLNPFLPEPGIPIIDYLRMKFGDEAAEKFLSGSSPVVTHGKTVGITFNTNRLVVATKKPHILLDYASKHGKQHELQETMFRAYFSEGRNVSSEEVLRDLANEVGLNGNEAIAALSNKEYIHEFEEGVKMGKMKGITSVPTFDFYLKDNPQVRQSISGAQQVDTFVSVCSRLKSLAKM